MITTGDPTMIAKGSNITTPVYDDISLSLSREQVNRPTGNVKEWQDPENHVFSYLRTREHRFHHEAVEDDVLVGGL